MFGGNQKISGRQLERLLVLDWLGKAGLLIPGFAGNAGGSSFLVSLLLAVVLTLGYAWILRALARRIETDFSGYVRERLGKAAAIFISVIYWLYAFVNTMFLLRLFASIAVTFILPETQAWILIVIAAAAAVYAAAGGLEVRARFGEVLYPVIVYPLLLMLLFAALSVRPDYILPAYGGLNLEMAKSGVRMFSAFGGIGIFLYLAPAVDSKKRVGNSMYRGVAATLAGEFLLFFMILGTFGEQGMKALPWPVLTLMSSVEIPGGFLQRWDVVFTALLMGSFFSAVAAGMYYLGFLTTEIRGKKKQRVNLLLPAAAVTAAACLCGEYRLAFRLYAVCSGGIFLPIAVFFTLLLAVLEYKRSKCEKWQKAYEEKRDEKDGKKKRRRKEKKMK